jgi:hypothetical protein
MSGRSAALAKPLRGKSDQAPRQKIRLREPPN